ncbi:MAG: hypothetical protein PWQ92_1544 [Thermococcaceae archaeon]|nr:hypothetical protein [Thermococcaceae archaeon]
MINFIVFIILLIIAAFIVIVTHIELDLINFLIIAVGGILGVFLLIFLSFL